MYYHLSEEETDGMTEIVVFRKLLGIFKINLIL